MILQKVSSNGLQTTKTNKKHPLTWKKFIRTLFHVYFCRTPQRNFHKWRAWAEFHAVYINEKFLYCTWYNFFFCTLQSCSSDVHTCLSNFVPLPLAVRALDQVWKIVNVLPAALKKRALYNFYKVSSLKRAILIE